MTFRNPIVAGEELVIPGIRSDNYKEASAGWRVGRTGAAQFSTINILGDGGTNGDWSGDSFHVGVNGLWLPDGTEVKQRLDALDAKVATSPENPLPGQVIKGIQFQTSSTSMPAGSTSTQTEASVLELDTGVIPVTGFYSWITDAMMFNNSLSNAITNFIRFRITGPTTDGTAPAAPSLTSTVNGQGVFEHHASTAQYSLGPAIWQRWLYAGQRYRVLLCYGPATPNVLTMTLLSFTTYVGTVFRFDGFVSDTSGIVGAYGSGINLSAGGGTQAPPPASTPVATKHTLTANASWSRSYDANLQTRLGDDTPYCYQGYVSSVHGDTRSLVGFDYAGIQSALSGATNITATLTVKSAHEYNSATGTTFKIGTHNYTAKPATWNTANVTESAITGGTAIQEGASKTFNLSSAIIANFQSGAAKGIAIGPAGTTNVQYYGYLYGATQVGHPVIVFTYYK